MTDEEWTKMRARAVQHIEKGIDLYRPETGMVYVEAAKGLGMLMVAEALARVADRLGAPPAYPGPADD